MPQPSRSLCCETTTMCGGHSLDEGVVIIGWVTTVVSTALLLASLTYLCIHKNRESRDPVWGVMTIATMTIVCMACYQLIISVLMLWQTSQRKRKVFFYTLWYVSHLSLIVLYVLIFSAIVVAHISSGYFIWGIAYFIICTGHIAMTIYFEIVINSYMKTDDVGDRFI